MLSHSTQGQPGNYPALHKGWVTDVAAPSAAAFPASLLFQPKKGGGISFNSTVTLTQCSEKLVQLILHEYKIFNAEVLF